MRKTFDIDFNSIEECTKVINQLKSRVGELKSLSGLGSKKDRIKTVFDACRTIYESDISKIYESLDLDTRNVYYVYAHCEPNRNIAIGKHGKSTFGATLGLEHIPFYIGKGTGNRAFDLNRNEQHRKIRQKIHKFNEEIVVKIIKSDLTEKEALMLESKLIDIFGLISDGGNLVNLDEGVNNKARREIYKSALKELSNIFKNSV